MISTQSIPQPDFTVGDKLLQVQSIINFRDDHPLLDEVINTSFGEGYCVKEKADEHLRFSSPHVDKLITLPYPLLGVLTLDYTRSDSAITGYIHASTDKAVVHKTIAAMTTDYINKTLAFMAKRTERLNNIRRQIA